jgi:two-component system cell cycle response regulator DivK
MTTSVRRSSCPTGAVVLLVQSERDDREMYAEYLAHMGLTPLCVREADAALRVACRADVIVTGLLLPGPIDGCALIDRLRHSADTCNIPIAVLTGCAWTMEEARARSAGCDVFLSKPCLPHVLLRVVRQMLAARTRGRRSLGGRSNRAARLTAPEAPDA